MDHQNRNKLVDVREMRAVAEPFEFRENAEGEYVLTGYAATWDAYDCYGGPDRGGWVEQLSRAAFQRTLSEQPDVMLLINHEGLPLARTKSGTLDLAADDHGLLMRARLDPADPDVQRLAPKMKPQANGKSNMDEMSFSFRVKSQNWNSDYTQRNITELSLQKGDVSVVNYGMNDKTRAVMSTDAVGALASLSNQDLMEVRSMDRTTLGRAMLTLERAWRSGPAPEDERATSSSPGGELGGDDDKDDDENEDEDKSKRASGGRTGTWVNFDGSHLLFDGVCITCQNDRAKTPSEYSNVSNFADPGYLGPDGKQAHDGNGVKRYPIDASHVKAAWSYINMPKNQKGYTAEQLSAIKGKIKSAMKKAGHDVSDAKALRADCPGGDDCPGDSCPEHGNRQDEGEEMSISHYESVRRLGGGTTLVAVMSDGSRTPLPSFRQSGQQVGSPAPAAFRAGPGGGGGAIAPNIIGGPLVGYDYSPNTEAKDVQWAETYTKDTSEVDNISTDSHTHEVPVPRSQSDDDDEDGDKPADDVDDERAADNPDDTIDDIAAERSLAVDDRLKLLRHAAELPDLPTVDEALNYIRQFA